MMMMMITYTPTPTTCRGSPSALAAPLATTTMLTISPPCASHTCPLKALTQMVCYPPTLKTNWGVFTLCPLLPHEGGNRLRTMQVTMGMKQRRVIHEEGEDHQ